MPKRGNPPGGADLRPPGSVTLRRVVSGPMLLLLVVGDILGAGIYILVGDVAGEIGAAAWLAFVLAFSIAALSAASYSALVTRFPGPAGSALYVEKAFGRETLTFFVGMAVMLSSLSTAATTARAFAGEYLGEFVDAPVVLVSVGVVGALTLLNIRGIEASARANVGMTLVEMGGLIVVVVIGLAALADGEGDPGAVTRLDGLGMDGVLTATSLAFFAFLGFEDAVHLSAEVRDGRRVFPRVLFGAVVVTSLLYLAVVLVATMLVPAGDLSASEGPLIEVVQLGPLAMSSRWFSLVALVAVSNTSLFGLVAASRLLFGMADSGALPPVFARVHHRLRTPIPASVTVAGGAAVLASTGAVSELAGAAVTLLLAVLVLVNVSAVATRFDPTADAAFSPPVFVPVLGAVLAGGLLTHQLVTSSANHLLRLGVLVFAVTGLWLANRLRIAGSLAGASGESGDRHPPAQH
jgi:APA family basic amino acid/polyamine antiporter